MDEKPNIERSSNTILSLIGIILLIITSFIIGNLTSSSFDIKSVFEGINTNSNVNQNKQISTNTGTKIPVNSLYNKLPPQTTTKKIGESFTWGNIEYQVISAINKGSEYSYKKSTGKYILVVIKATNVGQQEQGVSKVHLTDGNNRQYDINSWFIDISSKFKTYGSYNDYKGIPAGLSETFSAPFEVAKDSTGLKLEFPDTNGNIVFSVDLGL